MDLAPMYMIISPLKQIPFGKRRGWDVSKCLDFRHFGHWLHQLGANSVWKVQLFGHNIFFQVFSCPQNKYGDFLEDLISCGTQKSHASWCLSVAAEGMGFLTSLAIFSGDGWLEITTQQIQGQEWTWFVVYMVKLYGCSVQSHVARCMFFFLLIDSVDG